MRVSVRGLLVSYIAIYILYILVHKLAVISQTVHSKTKFYVAIHPKDTCVLIQGLTPNTGSLFKYVAQ